MSTLKAIKKGFLQKGWAGKTISRSETAERLDPIIRHHIRLNRLHDAAALDLSGDATSLADLQKNARALVGKLAETIYSCGGVAYQGTDLEPQDFRSTDSDETILRRLATMERDLQEAIQSEDSVEHQIRTRAILGAVGEACEERLSAIAEVGKATGIRL